MKKYLFFSTDAYCHKNVLLLSKLATNIGKKVLVVDVTRIDFLCLYFNVAADPSHHIFNRDDVDFCIGGLDEEQDVQHYDYVFYIVDSCMGIDKESNFEGTYLFLTQDKIDRKHSYELLQQGCISEMAVILEKILSNKIKPVMILSEVCRNYTGTIKKTYKNMFALDDYTKYLNNIEEGVINLKSYSKDLKIFISELYIDLVGAENNFRFKKSYFK